MFSCWQPFFHPLCWIGCHFLLSSWKISEKRYLSEAITCCSFFNSNSPCSLPSWLEPSYSRLARLGYSSLPLSVHQRGRWEAPVPHHHSWCMCDAVSCTQSHPIQQTNNICQCESQHPSPRGPLTLHPHLEIISFLKHNPSTSIKNIKSPAHECSTPWQSSRLSGKQNQALSPLLFPGTVSARACFVYARKVGVLAVLSWKSEASLEHSCYTWL